MGALSESRKRFPDLSPLSPPSKKAKTSSSQPILHRTAPERRHSPPMAPIRRPIHGPQRVLKAFGLGSGRKPRSEVRVRISGSGSRSATEVEPVEDLELEDYRRLVVEVEEAVRSPAVELPTVSEAAVDLRSLDLEAAETEEERGLRRNIPLYRELYQDSARKHDSRIRDLGFEVRLAEKRILGFRLVDEVSKKKREEGPQETFAPLTDEDEQEVDFALRDGKRQELLVVHEASGIEITREALRCLKGGAWLNDEVINLYLALLKERERREPKRFLKCHFFNTFFYKKLISGRNGYDFKAVKRWTTHRKLGYGLIDCDKIFVPIHKEVHWCLAIINVKDKKFQYLDSLGGMDKMALRVLARYLVDEVSDKSNKQIDTTLWGKETIEDLPLQENGWDCGMFMLKYTDFYSRGLSLTFGQEHMAYFRKRTAKEILKLKAE
ncbi:putative ubiquitin-like-specific protease 1B [Iris pallida]|uniref:Ubiquitin-like-specific protease 1B n=1 Tax=Iris pallida TaxID=29817 RepID=A0AAX6IHY5_IRIPA|nr:putative ubiquitin-like-specific protease 1B [Iris pallida]